MEAARARALARTAHKRGLERIPFTPMHPALGQDEKTFDESYQIGRSSEEVAFGLFQNLFPRGTIILPHCNVRLEDRVAGKRAIIDGQNYVLPDYEIVNLRYGIHCLVDIKGKQYHWYLHKDSLLMQAVNKNAIDDYVAIADSTKAAPLILIHLWPAYWMGDAGQAPTARIHTGMGYPVLDEAVKQCLLGYYPVEDAYYLVNARHFQRYGQQGREQGALVYNLPVDMMIQGPGPGLLPPLKAWLRTMQEPTLWEAS